MSNLTSSEALIAFIKNSEKKTPVKCWIKGNIKNVPSSVMHFGSDESMLLVGNWDDIQTVLNDNQAQIQYHYIENDRRNSGVPTLDLKNINARIEPGAIIRDKVTIGDNAVIMLGAVINIGAEIGAGTMIDMGAILGGRAIVGKNCHIGAGAVLAGVIEPPSAKPVTIEDNVLVGANAVIVEGVHVGANAVIGAGAIVLEDVPANAVVAGNPAKVIKEVDQKTKDKTQLVDDLRK